jgi:hypothetical protein
LTDRCLIYRNVAQERNFPCRRTAATRGRRSPSRVGGGAYRAALGGDNALRRVYDVVLAWERGAWDEVSLAAARLGLRSEPVRRSSAYAPAPRAATIGGSSSTSCTFRVRASAVKGF